MTAFVGKDNGDGTTTFPNTEVRRMYAEIDELQRCIRALCPEIEARRLLNFSTAEQIFSK